MWVIIIFLKRDFFEKDFKKRKLHLVVSGVLRTLVSLAIQLLANNYFDGKLTFPTGE
jgi:hypothetical protein